MLSQHKNKLMAKKSFYIHWGEENVTIKADIAHYGAIA
jgi:hypothetical protein